MCRSAALRLDRRRFRRLRQAAQLHAAGDHFQARLAVQEAKAIKVDADEAHRAAAAKIELRNNSGKEEWELDLHGLHAQEANGALDRRCGNFAWNPPSCSFDHSPTARNLQS